MRYSHVLNALVWTADGCASSGKVISRFVKTVDGDRECLMGKASSPDAYQLKRFSASMEGLFRVPSGFLSLLQQAFSP
jgi:hypothetical protein